MTDSQARAKLAHLLRDRLDEIVETTIRIYPALYPYSTGGCVAFDHIHDSRAYHEMAAFIDEIETGDINPAQYVHYGGDIVLQRNKLFSGLANYIESRLYYGQLLAPFVWEACSNDYALLDEMLACLSSHIHSAIEMCAHHFLENEASATAITQTWELSTVEAVWGHVGTPGSGGEARVSVTPAADGASVPTSAGSDRLAQGTLLASLTTQERRVVALVVEGKTNGEIAATLGLRPGTVKSHLARVFDKLGVSSRTELAAFVLRRQDLGRMA